MAKTLCELVVRNKQNATRSIARSILGPKQQGLVRFYTVGQLEDALAIERHGGIEIKTSIPKKVADKLTVKMEMINKDAEIIEEEKTEEVVEKTVEKTEEKETAVLTREEVIAKTEKELRAYAKENKIKLEGINSRSSSAKVTDAMLSYLGYELLSEGEKA